MFLQQNTSQLSVTKRGTHALKRKRNGVVELLKHTHPHMCYHAEFGRSAVKGVCKNRGEAVASPASGHVAPWRLTEFFG